MFFRKKKNKQDASEAPKLEQPEIESKNEVKTKGVKPKKEKREPTPLPFTPEPRCPKCAGHFVNSPKYCKGKKFLIRRCEHKMKGEHLHLSCACGFRWAQACQPENYVPPSPVKECSIPLPVIDKPEEVKEETWFEKADKNLRHFFEEELGCGPGFYDELKALMVRSENLPGGTVYADRETAPYYKKLLTEEKPE